MNLRQTLRGKWHYWRYKRACRRRKVATRERKRLQDKYYEQGEMDLSEAIYELARATVVGMKLKVWP